MGGREVRRGAWSSRGTRPPLSVARRPRYLRCKPGNLQRLASLGLKVFVISFSNGHIHAAEWIARYPERPTSARVLPATGLAHTSTSTSARAPLVPLPSSPPPPREARAVVWDAATGRPACELDAASVHIARVFPDGRKAASARRAARAG